MSNENGHRRGSWLSADDMAGALGITHQGFRSSYVPAMDPGDIRPGRPILYFAPAVIRIHVERSIERALRDDGGSLIAAADSSPGLERLRIAKASLAELELLERLGELVPRILIRETGEATCAALKAASHDLQRRFGPEGVVAYNEAIATARQIALQAFGDSTTVIRVEFTPPGEHLPIVLLWDRGADCLRQEGQADGS